MHRDLKIRQCEDQSGVTAPTALPATSIVALVTLPATEIGAVTICVHPDNKIKVMVRYSVDFLRLGI